MDDDRIIRLAERAQLEPESLTAEEVRELALAVLCDINDSGEMIKGSVENAN